MMEFLHEHVWALVIAIFLARVCDVSLGTVRTIMVFRGYRTIAAFIGFFEVLIWILAAGQVIRNLNHWYLAVAYASGFATGNIVGIWLEGKLAIGSQLVRTISANQQVCLVDQLRDEGYSVTAVEGCSDGNQPVEIAFIAEKRREVPQLLDFIKNTDPEAFFTVEDVKKVHHAKYIRFKKPLPSRDWRGIMKKK